MLRYVDGALLVDLWTSWGPEDLLVDFALDSARGRPASASIAGPDLRTHELAGGKVTAFVRSRRGSRLRPRLRVGPTVHGNRAAGSGP